jgi:hypothetical protein|tara:strand:+ start:564 stop:911 length:348 start_codon:yes stop_codon:yes gene_type:complete
MSTAQKEASKRASKRIKKLKDDKKIASTKDQADILGERFDKKFMKLAESKEAQLRAKDFDAGLKRAEDRAIKETMQEAGMGPMLMSKGGRAMYKSGMRVCKLAKKGKGRAYGKNS